MIKENKLKDALSALLMSYFIVVSVFQVCSRFFYTEINVAIAVVGLILAIVFLFVNPNNRRTMRIVSIACNSISIGATIGVLYSTLHIILPMMMCIIISIGFILFTYIIYSFLYRFKKKILPTILIGIFLLLVAILYYIFIFDKVDSVYNYYLIIMYIMIIIHYIIAIIIMDSDKNTIITGMAYGYFSITIVVIVVVAIFLLLASEGDIDFDISGGDSHESKSSKIKESSKDIKTNHSSVEKVSRATKDNGAIPYSSKKLFAIDMTIDTLDAITDALLLQDIYVENIDTIEKLDELYDRGLITRHQYFILLEDLENRLQQRLK